MEPSVTNSAGYTPVSKEDSESSEVRIDVHNCDLFKLTELRKHQRIRQVAVKAVIILQSFMVLALVLAVVVLKQQASNCLDGPKPPYSPLYDDGAVKLVNNIIHHQPVFEHETSPELEEAWERPIKEHDNGIKMPLSMVAEGKLPESVELLLDPGYGLYAVSVYHQYHCLNRIRKSFYPEKFFSEESRDEIEFHKNHCFDLLRQVVLCNGDPSLVYWWNDNYTYVDETGTKHYTEEYLNSTPLQRSRGAFVKWDVPTQCRDMDAIDRWIEDHQIDREKYDQYALEHASLLKR